MVTWHHQAFLLHSPHLILLMVASCHCIMPSQDLRSWCLYSVLTTLIKTVKTVVNQNRAMLLTINQPSLLRFHPSTMASVCHPSERCPVLCPLPAPPPSPPQPSAGQTSPSVTAHHLSALDHQCQEAAASGNISTRLRLCLKRWEAKKNLHQQRNTALTPALLTLVKVQLIFKTTVMRVSVTLVRSQSQFQASDHQAQVLLKFLFPNNLPFPSS